MVWIHGGFFKTGDGYNVYGPEFLINKDVLLVTFNYRLGPLGFLSLENDILSGNFGLKDQVQALRWVQENIASFGGDPNKVTIFGESAGGSSVQYHILSSLSKGLFQKAIVQSGTALSPWAFNSKPKELAIRLAQTLGSNSTDLNQLYNIFMNASPSDLIAASESIFNNELQEINKFNPGFTFAPCVEVNGKGEKFITQPPREIFESGNFTKVPTIMGTLDGDGFFLLLLKRFTDNDFKNLNEHAQWAVPMNWNVKQGFYKYAFGQLIKQYYFGNNNASWDNIKTLLDFITDTHFVMDTQFSLSTHVKNTNVPIYNYEFTLETSTSFKGILPLIQGRLVNLKGAMHGDELPLIFNPQDLRLEKIILLKEEKKISEKMVMMWTSFAKTGNPNYSGLEVKWEPLKTNKSSYLEIGTTLKMHEGKVRQQSLKYYKTVCELALTDYTCSAL